ncbi:MAG: toll/interleukin-1 receptor domain-containing protein, partial [Candidatus Sulfotelmatobacter sp.]
MKSIRPQIFLSYSRSDAEFVGKLRDDLVHAGIGCWLDTDAITAGDRLQDAIFGDGIPQCNLFVAYITQKYFESEWCKKELD